MNYQSTNAILVTFFCHSWMPFLDIVIDITECLHLTFCPLVDSFQECVIKHLRLDVRNGKLIDGTKEDDAIYAVAKAFVCTVWTAVILA